MRSVTSRAKTTNQLCRCLVKSMEINEIETALEGILFAAGDPVPADRLSAVLGIDRELLEHALDNLSDYYKFNRRGIRLVRLEDSYQLTTAAEYAEYVRQTLEVRKQPSISKAALEVLSIIAYYQPTTRAYIEQIRGVDSSGTLSTLLERSLIQECGHLEVPGRPKLYSTTSNFLRAFGISSIDELPQISEYEQAEGQMAFEDLDRGNGWSDQEGDKNDITKEIASEISDDQTDKGVRSILEEDLHDINGLPDD
jgi:segregation and condensation protein B